MNKEISTVLITAAGTATSINIVKYLSCMPRIRIVTTDTNPVEMIPTAKRWNTVHYQVPLASDHEAFLNRLIEICRMEHVDFLYPVHDLEILHVLEARDLFPKNLLLPALGVEAVRECNDKWINYRICRSTALPVPDTWLGTELPNDVFDTNAELIRKPRNGVGSIGARRVKSFDELTAADDLNEKVIYQVPCSGPEYTVDVLNLGSRLYAITRERLETKAGVCTKADVFISPALTDLAQRISRQFALSGLFCFQVIAGSADRFTIIDINPRCGGGTALTSAAGFPIYETYFSGMLGLDEHSDYINQCNERTSRSSTATVCRYYEEIVTRISL